MKAILNIPKDYQSAGEWTETLYQYFKDWYAEDGVIDDGDSVHFDNYTDEVEFMHNIGWYYEQFCKLYLKQ